MLHLFLKMVPNLLSHFSPFIKWRPQVQNLPSPPHLTIIVLCITLNFTLKYSKMFGWSISFLFMKLYGNVPITGIFTKPPSF